MKKPGEAEESLNPGLSLLCVPNEEVSACNSRPLHESEDVQNKRDLPSVPGTATET